MHATFLFSLAVCVAAPAPKDPPKKDPAILGEWIVDSVSHNGKVLPLGTVDRRAVFTADGKVIVKEDGQITKEENLYRIDAKKEPAEIDLSPPEQGKSGAASGIFKIEGDTLTICFAMGGAERPKEFKSPEGKMVVLMIFRRVKQ